MALTASSTLDDVRGQYLANAAYSTAASALLFIEACRALKIMLPTSSMSGQKRADFTRDIDNDLRRAEQWYAANVSTSGTGNRAFDLSGGRC